MPWHFPEYKRGKVGTRIYCRAERRAHCRPVDKRFPRSLTPELFEHWTRSPRPRVWRKILFLAHNYTFVSLPVPRRRERRAAATMKFNNLPRVRDHAPRVSLVPAGVGKSEYRHRGTSETPTSPREREREIRWENYLSLLFSEDFSSISARNLLLFATADVGSHANKTPLTLCCLRLYDAVSSEPF